jgi:hypothetical protein
MLNISTHDKQPVTTFISCGNGNDTFYLMSILLSIMNDDRCDIMHPKNTNSANTYNSEVHNAGIKAFKEVMNLQQVSKQNI